MQSKSLVAVAVVMIIGSFPPLLEDITSKAISIVAGLIALNGAWSRRQPQDPRPAKDPNKSKEPRKRFAPRPFRLNRSFEGGLYGGMIGGMVAGAIIGPLYYNAVIETSQAVIWEIIVYAVVAGMLFEASSRALSIWFRHLGEQEAYPGAILNEVSACSIAGVAAGAAVGALGGWYFRSNYFDASQTGLLAGGATAGGILVTLGSLFFDFRGAWVNAIRALSFAIVLSAFAAGLGAVLLSVYWDTYS